MNIRRVTLLGGTGFIGRAVAAHMAASGIEVIAAARHAESAKLPASVTPLHLDVRDEERVRHAVAKADAVAYLPGIVQAREEATFRAVHVDGPRACARAARAAGTKHFVFVSALGVRRDAPSMADRTKAEGEDAVRKNFPGAAIVRPSLVVGRDDHFVSATARMLHRLPVIPLFGNGGRTLVQPVHIDDMAAALTTVLTHSGAAGCTYEIGGPDIYAFRTLMEIIRRHIGARCALVPVPDALALVLAAVLERLPSPPLVRDQVRLMHTDKIVSGRHETLAELGIAPRALEDVLPEILAVKQSP